MGFVRKPTATPSKSHENEDSLFDPAPRLRTAHQRCAHYPVNARVRSANPESGYNTTMKGNLLCTKL
jgi:hypothetical protein